jgi:hypothetical protein
MQLELSTYNALSITYTIAASRLFFLRTKAPVLTVLIVRMLSHIVLAQMVPHAYVQDTVSLVPRPQSWYRKYTTVHVHIAQESVHKSSAAATQLQ